MIQKSRYWTLPRECPIEEIARGHGASSSIYFRFGPCTHSVPATIGVGHVILAPRVHDVWPQPTRFPIVRIEQIDIDCPPQVDCSSAQRNLSTGNFHLRVQVAYVVYRTVLRQREGERVATTFSRSTGSPSGFLESLSPPSGAHLTASIHTSYFISGLTCKLSTNPSKLTMNSCTVSGGAFPHRRLSCPSRVGR